jgi:predicted RNA binding protein YcfA (HicA-like mRNA interferase family)
MHSGHVMLVNPSHPGVTIAVSVHAGETVATGTLRRIIHDAGLSVEEFCRLLGG